MNQLPRALTSPLTSMSIVSLSFLSPRRRPCHSPDTSRFKISLLRTGAETCSCIAAMGESFPSGQGCWREAVKRQSRTGAGWLREGSQLWGSALGFSLSSQEWVPVSFGFSYSVLFLKQFPVLKTAHTILLVTNHAMNTFKETKEGDWNPSEASATCWMFDWTWSW